MAVTEAAPGSRILAGLTPPQTHEIVRANAAQMLPVDVPPFEGSRQSVHDG